MLQITSYYTGTTREVLRNVTAATAKFYRQAIPGLHKCTWGKPFAHG